MGALIGSLSIIALTYEPVVLKVGHPIYRSIQQDWGDIDPGTIQAELSAKPSGARVLQELDCGNGENQMNVAIRPMTEADRPALGIHGAFDAQLPWGQVHDG